MQVKGNHDGTKDVVQPVAYDAFGREEKNYLPYTTDQGLPGSYRADALTPMYGNTVSAQQSFYNSPPTGVVTIPTPFAMTVFALTAEPGHRAKGTGQRLATGRRAYGKDGIRQQYQCRCCAYRKAL